MRIPVPSVFRIKLAAAPSVAGETEAQDQRPPEPRARLLWLRGAKDIRRPGSTGPRGIGHAHLDEHLLNDIGLAWWEVQIDAPKGLWR